MRLVASTTYKRAIRKLLSVEERKSMEAAIAADPQGAPVIPGSGGIRKVRWARGGGGKRGGIRTIYFLYAETTTIYLLTAYAKAEQDDLRPGDLRDWAKLVRAIKKGVRQ